MTIRELQKLSDEELREISLRKNSKGCATADADRAQQVRRERANYWAGIPNRTTYESTLNQERGSGFTKKFK
jgi:hypothetical protein